MMRQKIFIFTLLLIFILKISPAAEQQIKSNGVALKDNIEAVYGPWRKDLFFLIQRLHQHMVHVFLFFDQVFEKVNLLFVQLNNFFVIICLVAF